MVVEIWGKGLLNVQLLIDGETRFGWSRNLGHGPPRFGSSAGEKPAPPGVWGDAVQELTPGAVANLWLSSQRCLSDLVPPHGIDPWSTTAGRSP